MPFAARRAFFKKREGGKKTSSKNKPMKMPDEATIQFWKHHGIEFGKNSMKK